MSWLAIILFVMQHLPDLISIVEKIIELIHGLPHADRVQARQEMTAAIKANDLGKFREVATSWHRKCLGVACPADLVGE